MKVTAIKMWKEIAFFLLTTAAAMGQSTVELSSKNDMTIEDPQKHIQLLIKSSLEGEQLLEAYNTHYAALSEEARIREKAGLPQNVYEYIADYRESK